MTATARKPTNTASCAESSIIPVFSQTLILPDDVDKEKIEAKMSDGVLTIILPKVREENDPKISHSINIE